MKATLTCSSFDAKTAVAAVSSVSPWGKSSTNSLRKAFSYERSPTGKAEWLTPRKVLAVLGDFDLDPCAPVNRPWPMAKHHFTTLDNGLVQPWFGRVWLNPPYGRETGLWLARLARHGNGIALTFARTETRMFHDWVWNQGDAILFLRGRLTFCNADGSPAENSGVAPSCLIAYGRGNVVALARSGLRGKMVQLHPERKRP